MAEEYFFEIASDIDCAQAKRLLVERLDAKLDGEGLVYKAPELLIFGSDVKPGRSRDMTEEDFHFIPSLHFIFRYQREGTFDEFAKLMLRATLVLLDHGQDAILLFNGETITLQRFGGHLAFNTDYALWSNETLMQEVHVPFEWRSLPSPLLKDTPK